MASLLIRGAWSSERNAILDSAWRSIRRHPMAEDLAPDVVGQLVGVLLDRWTCVVAADPDTDTILGWLLYRDADTVGWCFVKPWSRRKGIASALLNHAGISSTVAIAFPTTDRVRGYSPHFRPFLSAEVALARR